MKRMWITGLLLLVGLWLLVLGGMNFARSRRMTSDKLQAYIEANRIEEAAGRERERIINRFTSRVNRLPFEERQELWSSREAQRFFQQMNDSERAHVFEKTLPSGMNEMMNALNEMEPDKRREFVERASDRMRRFQREAEDRDLDEIEKKSIDMIAKHGLRAYMRDADAQTKVELQPLMEQMQHMLRRVNF